MDVKVQFHDLGKNRMFSQTVDYALAMVEAAFRQTTLAEVLAEPTNSRPLCELPTRKKARRWRVKLNVSRS